MVITSIFIAFLSRQYPPLTLLNIFHSEFPRATYLDFVTYVRQFLEKKNVENRQRMTVSAGNNNGVGRERGSVGGALNRRSGEKAVFFELKCGHLFDRLITAHILSNRNINTNINTNANSSSSNSNIEEKFENRQFDNSLSTASIPVSVTYMLVALNMAVKTAAEERVDSLFHTAQLLSKNSAALNLADTHELSSKSEILPNSTTEGKEIEGVVDAVENNLYATIDQSTVSIFPSEVDSEALVSVRAVEEIVRDLYDSWQVSEGH